MKSDKICQKKKNSSDRKLEKVSLLSPTSKSGWICSMIQASVVGFSDYSRYLVELICQNLR